MAAERGRSLLIQLARLGDVLQSFPAIMALKAREPSAAIDLLCAAPLSAVGSWSPLIARVLPWAGQQWRSWGEQWDQEPARTWRRMNEYMAEMRPERYAAAYNVNQHARAVLAAHLLADRVVGVGAGGPLDRDGGPWGGYLRQVAAERGPNRVHLADAFCGLCGVVPTGEPPHLDVPRAALPEDLVAVGDGGTWIAVVVGAGDAERRLPIPVWAEWVRACLAVHADARVVFVGTSGERELAGAIQDALPPLAVGRTWNAVGRTSLRQLASLLSRCDWVVGSDTGPLHLGAAVGARAMGFFSGRARVHETGPYGHGHWVWQCQGRPTSWPVHASLAVLSTGVAPADGNGDWSLWRSRVDRWGAFFVEAGQARDTEDTREAVWRRLSPGLTLVSSS
ncbi:glycosyltransferase family 9 protein [Candidatus Nitrospira bockiana]